MPRTCTICNHLQRPAIEAALLSATSLRHIASRFDTSTATIRRHQQSCIAETLSKACDIKETLNGATLLARLKAINQEALAILKESRQSKMKDNDTALKAIARVEKQIELEAKLLGQLNDAPQVNINLSIDKLQVVLMTALAPFPDARIAVAQALMEAKL